MFKVALWLCIYAFLIFWSFEAFYWIWRLYRNDALPRFRQKASRQLPKQQHASSTIQETTASHPSP
jgi:hypothetical protein